MVSAVFSLSGETAHVAAASADSHEAIFSHAISVSELLLEWEDTIRGIARRHAPRYSDLDDLLQAGRLALCRAVENYDPSVPTPFSHYAKRAIRFGVIREAGRLSRQRDSEKSSIEDNPEAIDLLASFGTCQGDGAATSLADWIGSLPERQRELYRLLYVEGLTQRAAAVSLGTSQPRIAQLHRALLSEGAAVLA